ncbi:MAG TPA: hypothetical protein VFV87_10645 [Pirellulaceae bacterium]|nr:hypothetical protein [Pirellulaceae bacterium]
MTRLRDTCGFWLLGIRPKDVQWGVTSAPMIDGQGKGTILNDDGVATGGNKTSAAAAVDAAIEQLIFSSPMKRG